MNRVFRRFGNDRQKHSYHNLNAIGVSRDGLEALKPHCDWVEVILRDKGQCATLYRISLGDLVEKGAVIQHPPYEAQVVLNVNQWSQEKVMVDRNGEVLKKMRQERE